MARLASRTDGMTYLLHSAQTIKWLPQAKWASLTAHRAYLNRFLTEHGPYTDPDAGLGPPIIEKLSTVKVL
jgi:hypothetical protein